MNLQNSLKYLAEHKAGCPIKIQNSQKHDMNNQYTAETATASRSPLQVTAYDSWAVSVLFSEVFEIHYTQIKQWR
jgi:hypothetical protein